MCRLINAFEKIRQRYSKKKMLKKDVRSCYVYENKQISDKKPARKSGIYVLDSDICV
jgi:hypothetical protein